MRVTNDPPNHRFHFDGDDPSPEAGRERYLPNDPDPLWMPLRWPMRAAIILVGHLAVALVLVSVIWLTQRYLEFLYGDHGHLSFGVLPFSWLFDIADLSIMALFLTWALVEAHRELKRK
jgi:hypothetical protein